MKLFKEIRYINSFRPGAVLIIFIAASSLLYSQQADVLDMEVSVNMKSVKKSTILKSLEKQTGYVFTYDTQLIKPYELTSYTYGDTSLKGVLNHIFRDMNFGYSVIENHIIIYKKIDEHTPLIREEGRKPVYQVTGQIVDATNKSPLPYATIGIYRKGIGTVSNEEGYFSLKIKEDLLSDTLRISYLGFNDMNILVCQAIENNYTIGLERNYVPIPEIIIRARQPEEILHKVIDNIKKNYGNSPAQLTAFYREAVSKKEKIQIYSEAIVDIYKSSYTRSVLADQISVFKSRKIENLSEADTLVMKLQSGLYSCLNLDGIKHTFDFINSESFDNYDFRMTDIVNMGNEAAYLIEFGQKEYITDNALFQGQIYINTDDYGVHSAEFEINPEYIDLLTNSFVRIPSRQYRIKLKSVKYKVDYRSINNRYYLNHVRGDLSFSAKKKRKLFASAYNILFEMAVTSVDSVDVRRFSRDEIEPRHTVFSESISTYDPAFWGTDNYMLPEEDIRKSIELINSRMQHYNKDNQ